VYEVGPEEELFHLFCTPAQGESGSVEKQNWMIDMSQGVQE